MKLDYKDYWVEMFVLFAAILGIFLFASANTFLNYVLIILAGFSAGRILYKWKGEMKFPYYLIIIGFIIGVYTGTFISGANWMILILLFIISNIIGYKFHKRKFL